MRKSNSMMMALAMASMFGGIGGLDMPAIRPSSRPRPYDPDLTPEEKLDHNKLQLAKFHSLLEKHNEDSIKRRNYTEHLFTFHGEEIWVVGLTKANAYKHLRKIVRQCMFFKIEQAKPTTNPIEIPTNTILSKEEAIYAMHKGHKVTHRLFTLGEYVYIKDRLIHTEDGAKCTQEEFWKHRSDRYWETDWELYTENN